MTRYPKIIVVHKIGSMTRLYTTDIRVEENLITSQLWFVTDEVTPKILRAVDYCHNYAVSHASQTPIHPLVYKDFVTRRRSGAYLLVEEVCVPSARNKNAHAISNHFNWPLVRRW